MTVNKFKGRSWQMDFFARVGGKSVRVKKACRGATNRSEALAMERAERARVEGRGTLAAPPLFAEFRVDFLEKYAKANNKPSEYDSKRDILAKHLGPAFDILRLDEILEEDIEAFKADKLAAGLAPKTVNNHLATLSKLFNVARAWRRIHVVPLIQRLKVPTPDFDFLTFDEAKRLLAGAELEWKPMIGLALNTGMRQGELLGVRREDVFGTSVKVRHARVRGIEGTPKSNKPRDIPLNAAALWALTYCPVGGYLFCGPEGRPLTKGECKWPLWAACKRAGLRRIGWHVLRHTFASHLAMRGVPIKSIQELLGHSSILMTMRYAHLSPDVKVSAVHLLDEEVRGGT